jgi:hypothetical protein
MCSGCAIAGDTLVTRISRQELTTPVGGLVGSVSNLWVVCMSRFAVAVKNL